MPRSVVKLVPAAAPQGRAQADDMRRQTPAGVEKPGRAGSTQEPPAAEPDTAVPPATVSLGALSDVLGYHIAQASVTTVDMFERHIGERFNLRKVEFSILMLLLENGALSPKRLGQVLALTAPNLTLLLDRLQQRHLLRRERNQTDRRSQNIVLTEAGLRLSRESAAAAGPMERELDGRLSAAERAMLLELLNKVAAR